MVSLPDLPQRLNQSQRLGVHVMGIFKLLLRLLVRLYRLHL